MFKESLAKNLHPGGIVVMIDFHRDPGKMVTHSPDWILEHLRAGRHEFIMEILNTGKFELIAMPELEQLLVENYCMMSKRREISNKELNKNI